MRMITTLIICVLTSTLLFSQKKISGRIFYTNAIEKLESKRADSIFNSAPKDVQKMLKNILGKNENVTGVLEFSNSESLYFIEDKMDNDADKTINLTKIMAGGNNKFYANSKTDDYFKQRLRDEPLRIQTQKQDWEITQETKKIGQYLCFKAYYSSETENRKGEKITTITTAWFTPQIPVNFGPKDYFGLPGLILEVQKGKTTIIATKIVLNPKKEIKIKMPTKGKRISYEEYREMTKNFFKNIDKMRN